MDLKKTFEWLRSEEEQAFSLPKSRTSWPIKEVDRFLSNSTALNTIMPADEEGPYTSGLVKQIYEWDTWDEFRLKRYVSTDYPLAIIETHVQPGYRDKYLNILSGIYPFQKIDACARKSPYGHDVILISERLFSFLWDLYHAQINLLMKTSYDDLHDEWLNVERQFASNLNQGVYHDWNTTSIMKDEPIENISRYFILMSLIFVLGHELGHIFLGHIGSGKDANSLASHDKTSKSSFYSYSQIQEFEADLFSSDLYFTYLYGGFDVIDPDFFHFAHLSGFRFLKILARAQEGQEIRDFKDKSHPPGALRYTYILLRHRRKLEKQGFNIDGISKVIDQYSEEIPYLNYQKDLGVDSIFK